MQLDWWTLGLETINVLVLLWLLSRFLFRPVAKIMAERQAAAGAELEQARAEREAAKAEHEAAKATSDEIAAQRAGMIAKATEEAEAQRAALLSTAKAEAEAAREATRAELEKLRKAEAQAMEDDARALAADIATRLLDRLPDAARIDGFVDGLAEAVAELPETTRAGIGASGPVQLRAARALTPDETKRIKARLSEALGRKVTIAAETDPSLIAGLELDAPEAVVRNHFRADLETIRQELGHD